MEQRNLLHLTQRREDKYYVPLNIYRSLLKDLSYFTRPDDYSIVGGFYAVYSVYFDNFNLDSYCDKIEGQTNRFKIRLRFYASDIKHGQINAEIKYKFSNHGLKKKVIIDYRLFKKIMNRTPLSFEDFSTIPELKTFIALQKTGNFQPFIRINYQRQALFSKTDKNIRLNFDQRIDCCRLTNNCGDGHYIHALPTDKIILEIKYPAYLPYWLIYILKKYSLHRSSISKYVLAVQNLAVNSSLSVK